MKGRKGCQEGEKEMLPSKSQDEVGMVVTENQEEWKERLQLKGQEKGKEMLSIEGQKKGRGNVFTERTEGRKTIGRPGGEKERLQLKARMRERKGFYLNARNRCRKYCCWNARRRERRYFLWKARRKEERSALKDPKEKKKTERPGGGAHCYF